MLIRKEEFLQESLAFTTHTTYNHPDNSEYGLSSLHQHQFIEIGYVESGIGTHRIWNESYPITAGDMYILNIAVPHGFFSLSSDEQLVIHSLYFDPHDIFGGEITEIGGNRFLFGLFLHNNFAVHLSLKPKQLRFVAHEFNEIGIETDEQQSDWADMIRSRITILLLTCKRYTEKSNEQQIYSEKKDTHLVTAVLRLIQEHFADPSFSLKNASEILYKSPSSISRSFYEVTGIHFSDYLCSFRMQQAASLALETELSNRDIALLCGYCNFNAFYKQFRQVIGLTPGEYRRQNKIDKHRQNHILYTKISDKLQQCKRSEVVELVAEALDEGLPADEILNKGLVHGMNAIGEKFRADEIFIPEVLAAAQAMNNSMEVLKPHLVEAGHEPIGRAVICTVKGDLHDIGKNLVKLMLESMGIECMDLGVDVDASTVVKAVKEYNAQLVCLSALLTTTMMAVKEVIDALTQAGIRDKVRVMIGGAPITQEFADSIGADCYTPDAVAASKEAKRLLLEMKKQ